MTQHSSSWTTKSTIRLFCHPVMRSRCHAFALSTSNVLTAERCYCVCSAKNFENVLRYFAKTPPKFFTFNDGFSSHPPKSVDFVFDELLPSMFPTPSQYELAGIP